MAARAGKSQTLSLGSRPVLSGAKADPKTKFGGEGINFRARFVGSEEVMDTSGDKIAQAAIGRIRAACREAGGTKPKVLINLSFNGIKVADLKTKIWSINVPIPRLTYVAKDADDACVFCIIVARKKAGFKLFVYKAEQRIAAQIVQSIRELFQVVYKMVQQKKKKMEEAKSKSATALTKSPSDTAVARMTSDSKLLDPPPRYEEQDLDVGYSMVDFPPPPRNQAVATTKTKPPDTIETKPPEAIEIKPQEDNNLVDLSTDRPASQDNDIYAVPLTKKKRSLLGIPAGYQVPTSNKPALPSNHYQVPSNRPAPSQTMDAAKEWSVLDAELSEIAKELNMFADNNTSTPEQPAAQQQQRRQSNKPSIVDPFQDDFFDQPFNPRQGELDSFDVPDESITFESSDPFSSPDLSALSDNMVEIHDDPFTAFEFDSPTNDQPTAKNSVGGGHTETTAPVQQPMEEDTDVPPIPPDPLGVRTSIDEPPTETNLQSQIPSDNPFSITASVGVTTGEGTLKNWTTFDNVGALESDSNKAKKRSSMFENLLSSKQSTSSWSSDMSKDQTVKPIQPPPRNRRKSSRPHTVYGEQGIKTDLQSQLPTTNKPRFDLASIKPKTAAPQNDNTLEDPFMDLFMRKPNDDLTDMPNNINELEYTSTHL